MWKSDTFSDMQRLVVQHRLGQVVRELENFFLGHPTHPYSESFRTLASHYQLLAGYWLSGYEDADRERLFTDLLHQFYCLLARLAQHDCNKRSAFRLTLWMAAQRRSDLSAEGVRNSLEGFVSDLAMLSLEPEAQQAAKRANLYNRHQQLRGDLFNYIWTSELWQQADADAYRDMILSPTVDAVDQQLLVSAITMAALNVFDIYKFRVLAQVYSQATDEQLRQRALVGWVLVADADKVGLYPEIQDIIDTLCDDARCREELAELQMQLVFCIDADADSRRIRDEIMPDLLSHSNMKITRNGIVEQEEDTLEEILHPDNAERNMEKMEESMKKMMAMQQQGSDIYFAGFSQMKRFPFFNDLCNWFVPFYPQHPGISSIWDTARSRTFLHTITRVGAFCDSDKYSFVLAFDQVVSRLPQSMLELIEKGEAVPTPVGGEVDPEEQRKPAFIRRIYLQDLYRFFKLYPMRSEFRNPFGEAADFDYLFFANRLFSLSPLSSHYVQIASFFVKRKMYKAALRVLQCCDATRRDYQFYMMMGLLVQREPEAAGPQAPTVAECYRRACELKPDSERALSGMARSLFAEGSYAEAEALFSRLLLLTPAHTAYELGHAACLLNQNRSDEALPTLFRLHYDSPDEPQVRRTLAWALTLSSKFEQAMKHYDQLMGDKPQADDLLNYGYCLWLQHRNQQAADVFRRLQAARKDFDFEHEFLQPDIPFLQDHGIGEVEARLMLDQLNV